MGPDTAWGEDHEIDEDEETLNPYRLDRTRADSVNPYPISPVAR